MLTCLVDDWFVFTVAVECNESPAVVALRSSLDMACAIDDRQDVVHPTSQAGSRHAPLYKNIAISDERRSSFTGKDTVAVATTSDS